MLWNVRNLTVSNLMRESAHLIVWVASYHPGTSHTVIPQWWFYPQYVGISRMKWNSDNSNCREPPKKFEFWKVWIMRSICFSHVATIVSPFHSSVFHFLVKLSKICDFLLIWKEKNEVKLVTQGCKHTQLQKRQFNGTNGSSSVRVMAKSSRYAQQVIITKAGTMKFGLSEASFRVIRGRVNRVSQVGLWSLLFVNFIFHAGWWCNGDMPL